MKNPSNESTKIYLFGIALFSYLALISTVYLTRIILENFFIINEVPFKNSFWIYNCVSLLLFIVGITFSLNLIKKLKSINYIRTLVIMTLILILAQLMQFLFTFYSLDFILENYSDEFDKYSNIRREKPIYISYNALFEYLKYLSIGIIVFINIRKSKINSIS
jgi:hypothetical protein